MSATDVAKNCRGRLYAAYSSTHYQRDLSDRGISRQKLFSSAAFGIRPYGLLKRKEGGRLSPAP